MKEDEKGRAEAPRERPLLREDPLREGPIRSWWNLLRGPQQPPRPAAGSRGAGNGDGGAGAESFSDAVDRGVRLGYEVIDDQIRQGQRVAEELNARNYGVQSMNRDMQEIVTRSARYYMDMASLFMDFMTRLPSALGTPPGAGMPGGAGESPANGGWGAAAAAAAPWLPAQDPATPPASPQAKEPQTPRTPVDLRVVAKRPVTVRLDLDPVDPAARLTLPTLICADPESPPITGIRFEPADGESAAAFSVEVPDEQPPGVYSGVVFEAGSGEKCGTLTLRLE
ncbi:MAG: hypothetical protein R3325_00425 [Thermoanaerobaculia bacterium]|nr:hypothetical protein [Thermoanaerobaculia bacterium]